MSNDTVDDLDIRISEVLSNLSIASKNNENLLVVCPLETYVGSDLTAFRCILTVSNFARILESRGYTCSIFGIAKSSIDVEFPHFDRFKIANVDEYDCALERLKILAQGEYACHCDADSCIDTTKVADELRAEKFANNIRHCVIRAKSNLSITPEAVFASRLVTFCRTTEISTVISVFPENHQHSFGHVLILCRLLQPQLKFVSFSVGIVKCACENALRCDELLTIRKQQLLEVYKRKHPFEKDLSNSSITSLLWTCISFEFLTKSINKPLLVTNLAIDLPDTAIYGLKAVYNYARIFSIIEKFNNEVDLGNYRPLEPLSKLNGGTKNKVLESMKEFLNAFSNVESVEFEKLTPCCSQLIHFTRKFSKFYRRNQILVDPSPVLLESLYAKMHVLLCLKKCLESCFDSLCIEPVKQM